MVRRFCALGCLALLPLASWPAAEPAKTPSIPPAYKSPLGLAVDQAGKRAYVACQSAGTVALVDLEKGKVLSEVKVGRGPHDLVLAGRKVFVTCEDEDTLVVLDAANLKILQKLPVGQAPRGLAIAPDGMRAFVACHDEQALQSIMLADGKSQSSPLPGWPERVVWHCDAKHASVLAVSILPGKAAVTVIRPDTKLRHVGTSWLKGVTNVHGLASASMDNGMTRFALLPHQKPRIHIPTTQVTQGWVFTNTLGVSATDLRRPIDTPEAHIVAQMVLDDPYENCADPCDVVVTPGLRQYIFVSCAGADRVLVVNGERASRATLEALVSYLNYKHGADDLAGTRMYIRARLATQANPRRLALSGDGGTLVTSNHLADSLTVMDAKKLRVLRHIPLGGPAPDAARRGKILFNSAGMTFQGQFSCASCHPDGQADGLNWDLTRDGIGNFLNTRSLLGVKDTAPYGWYGTSPTLGDRVGGTLRHLHRHEPTPEELADLTAYLQSLSPPRPLPQKEQDKSSVARGRALFEGKAACARCHKGETFQDGLANDAGTATDQDPSAHLDTPSLRGVARTAPYLHDGRAATLEEIFTRYNPTRRHGAAHRLSAAELRDVIAFLNSL
jgi:YVTN family beta-propeller protein